MIICHEKEIIFLKTKKVASTSIEISLSEFCGESCNITPISPNDELIRQRLGFRGPQNFIIRMNESSEHFTLFNHMPAESVRNIFPYFWYNYVKFTIVRNPFDTAISRYFWEGGMGTGLKFGEYVSKYRYKLTENISIAPLVGPNAPDLFIRYEFLLQDLKDAGLGFLCKTLANVHAKGNIRPVGTYSLGEMYDQFPEAADIIDQSCRSYIERFGYNI